MTIPSFLYGTAWKEDATERLARLAIENGFRGIDTANQRRHYFEAEVGAAVAGAIRDGIVRREELFLQTKFTYRDSQDHRLPYDPNADLTTQVRPSFAQNRCFARTMWDREVRRFCRERGIRYQGFSLLTANLAELRSPVFREIVLRTQKTPAQVVFRFAIQIGMLPLTGTTDPAHMREDLGALEFELADEDVERMERL